MDNVITIGEPMVVFIAEEEGELKDVNKFSKGLAGSELNVSIGLSRLGHGVSYITQLGNDPFGEYIFDCIENEINIDKKYIKKTDNYSTGFYMKSKVSKGDPSIFYYRKNSAASNIDLDFIKKIDLSNYKYLHITGITPAISEKMRDNVFTLIEKAKENGLKISFDPNIRESLWSSKIEMIETLNKIAYSSDYIIPNVKEGKILTGKNNPEDIANFYIEKGVKNVIVKLGEVGCYIRSNDTSEYLQGFKVSNVVDTVGAGDAFVAGFLSGLLSGKDLVESSSIGNAMGAITVTHKGDNEGLPTFEKLQEFIENNA